MDLSTVRLNILSLFSGYGGIDLALKFAMPTTRTICYVERDAYAAAILVARMQDKTLDTAPLWSDVRTFDGIPWRGKVDLICGGFPCQDISQAGKRAGITGERSGLWKEYARIICEIRPRFIFVENVSALLSRGIERVLGDLAALGYDAEWDVFSAESVGAPHLRERLFILAYPHGQREPQPKGNLSQGGRWTIDDVKEVGVAHLAGSEGRRQPIGEGRNELPTWPPSPASPEWKRISQDFPELKPAVCRVVDGSSDRLDRLRVLGNGVVPQVAAEAWRELYGRIIKREL